MASVADDPPVPDDYKNLPISALRVTTRIKLAQCLDLDGTIVEDEEEGLGFVNNYQGLAELAGFSNQEIRNLERQESPTKHLLDKWNGVNANIGKLWVYLKKLGRFDIMTSCRRNILNDCKVYIEYEQTRAEAEEFGHYDPEEDERREMSIDETKVVDRRFVLTGETMKYDAFVSYSSEDISDRNFVRKMIQNLETKQGLKLFVPGRDDIAGSAEFVVTAYLIAERCKRVVILLSNYFLKSSTCEFQLRYAQSLSPGARSKRLIPIVKEEGVVIPRILGFVAKCDFTKPDIADWAWDKLYTALIAPVGKETLFEEEDTYNPFSEVQFPKAQPLGEDFEEKILETSCTPETNVLTNESNGIEISQTKAKEIVESSDHDVTIRQSVVKNKNEGGPLETVKPDKNGRNDKVNGNSKKISKLVNLVRPFRKH